MNEPPGIKTISTSLGRTPEDVRRESMICETSQCFSEILSSNNARGNQDELGRNAPVLANVEPCEDLVEAFTSFSIWSYFRRIHIFLMRSKIFWQFRSIRV